VEVAQAYAASQDQRIEWVRFRWPELLDDLESGHFDLALSGITVRADRSVEGRFSVPLTTSGAVVLVEASSNLRSPLDLQRPGLSLAVNAGGHLERVARALLVEARIQPIDQNEQVLERLGRDGIEAVMTDTLEAPIWQSQRPGLRTIGPLTNDRKAVWFPAVGAAGAQRFDRWLLRAEATGFLSDLRARHGLPETQTAFPPRALLASLDERLSLMIGVARAKRTLGVDVEDLARETRVLESASSAIQRAAERSGTPAPNDESIRQLYRAQIEAAKWIQHDWLDSQNPTLPVIDSAARAQARSDLDERLRPALIFLGQRIATLIVATANERLTSPSYEDVAQALSRHALPEAYLHALHDALVSVANPRRAARLPNPSRHTGSTTSSRKSEPQPRPAPAKRDITPSA